MKFGISLVLVLLVGLPFTSRILAQDPPLSPVEAAADLRVRLLDVQAREADGQAQLNALNEALRPENIERSLAGVGSTRPEELREHRRRLLTIERDGVRKQLELLATSRSRLESAIQVADTRAYQQSAQAFSANPVAALRIFSVIPPWLAIAIVIFGGLIGAGALVVCIRRP